VGEGRRNKYFKRPKEALEENLGPLTLSQDQTIFGNFEKELYAVKKI